MLYVKKRFKCVLHSYTKLGNKTGKTYVEVLELVSVEVSTDVDALAPDDDDLLTVQNGLGHDGGQTAQKMASSVDDDWLKNIRKIY